MANPEDLAILEQGAIAWGDWRGKNQIITPDLSGANLSKMDLRGYNFISTDLAQANLSGAILDGVNLVGADLTAADLSEASLANAFLGGAKLIGAKLIKARLTAADLVGADLSLADFIKADLSGATLSRANLMNARLVDTNLSRANVSYCLVYGVAAWDINLQDATQTGLVISFPGEPLITVDNLEVAQFIYLLLHNEKIRSVINTITTKVVLILGRFTPERKSVLESIRGELRKYDYVPVIFDFDKPTSRDTQETITTLARLARFVIADITDSKSIPQELISIVESLPSLPVQPLLKVGTEPWGMFDHIKRYPWVLPVQQYDQLDDLLASLGDKVIAPAEQKAKELEKR